MSLLHPWIWLLGAPLVLAPLAIHWLLRPRPLRIALPTLRFARAAGARDPHRRLRSRAILAARVLAMAAIAAAFSRPEIRALPRAGEGRALLLLIDASASMQAAGAPVSPWERARAEALRALERLGPADVANAILVGARPEPLLPTFTGDRAELARRLREASPTLERADARVALRLAARALERIETRRPEIGILADLQRATWAEADLSGLPEGARIWIVDAGGLPRPNGAVTALRARPAVPLVGEPVRIRYRVANLGRAPVERAVVIRIAGEVVGHETVSVAPLDAIWGERIVRFPSPGIREVEVALGRGDPAADALAADDTRWLALRVAERRRILLVSRDPSSRSDPAPYVARALEPIPGRGPFAPERIAASALDPRQAGGAEVIALFGPLRLDEPGLAGLRSHLARGGAVLYAIGGEEDRDALRGIDARISVGPTLRTGARLADVRTDGGLLEALRGAEPEILSAVFRRHASLRAPGARVLASFDDGEPAIARIETGGGLLLLWNFSPDPGSGDLIARDIFIPLVHETVRALRAETGPERPWHPGDAPLIALPHPARRFLDPRGERIFPRIEEGGGRVTAAFPPLRLRGIYRALDDGATVAAFAVNIDPDESELEAVPAARILPAGRTAAARRSEGGRLAADRIAGEPLWPALALAGLLFLLLEGAIALLDARATSGGGAP